MTFYQQLGLNISRKRTERKMSRSELARRMGVHRNDLMRWEAGTTTMPLLALLWASDALCCNHLILLPPSQVWRPERKVTAVELKKPVQWERDPPLTEKERTA